MGLYCDSFDFERNQQIKTKKKIKERDSNLSSKKIKETPKSGFT